MMQRIIVATINDQADFGKRMDREAFGSLAQAEKWAADQCERLKEDAEDPEYCAPVAEFDSIWFTEA